MSRVTENNCRITNSHHIETKSVMLSERSTNLQIFVTRSWSPTTVTVYIALQYLCICKTIAKLLLWYNEGNLLNLVTKNRFEKRKKKTILRNVNYKDVSLPDLYSCSKTEASASRPLAATCIKQPKIELTQRWSSYSFDHNSFDETELGISFKECFAGQHRMHTVPLFRCNMIMAQQTPF